MIPTWAGSSSAVAGATRSRNGCGQRSLTAGKSALKTVRRLIKQLLVPHLRIAKRIRITRQATPEYDKKKAWITSRYTTMYPANSSNSDHIITSMTDVNFWHISDFIVLYSRSLKCLFVSSEPVRDEKLATCRSV